MRIYRLYGPMDIREDIVPAPTPKAGEVQIKTAFVGICGSDTPRIYTGDGVPFYPNTLGHEFSAVVTQVGENVTDLQPGDRVAVAPRLVCGKCVHCRNGNAGQCVEGRFLGLGVPDIGGFAEYNVLPAKNMVKIPDSISLEEAAMIEPATVGLHALSLMNFDPEKPVAIIGVGTIGMLVMQCVCALGAKTVYVFDVDDQKLAKAKGYGATHCYNTREEGFLERFMQDTENYGSPQVVEAVGAEKTILLALEIASVMADIAMIGDVLGPITIPTFDYKRRFAFKQLHLHGIYQSYTGGFPGKEFNRAVQLIDEGKLDLKNMVASVDNISNVMKYFDGTIEKKEGKRLFTF